MQQRLGPPLRRNVILSGVAASRSEAATQSKDPYTSDTFSKASGCPPRARVERTLLSAAFDSDSLSCGNRYFMAIYWNRFIWLIRRRVAHPIS